MEYDNGDYGRLAPFAKHHGSLVRSVEFRKMVVALVRSLFTVNYYIFWLIFNTSVHGKKVKDSWSTNLVYKPNIMIVIGLDFKISDVN